MCRLALALAPVAAALTLAGCGDDSETVDTIEEVGSAEPLDENGVPVGTDAVVTDSEGEIRDRAQAATDAEMAQPQGKAFPTAFQGRWGLTAEACNAGITNEGRLIVSGDRLRFYESVATVDEIRVETPNRVSVTLDFQGEGEEWTETKVMEVSNDGRTLIRRDEDGPVLSYRRCGN